MLWPPPISSVAADSDPDGKELKTTKVGWTKAATELQKQQRSSLWHFPLQHIFILLLKVLLLTRSAEL